MIVGIDIGTRHTGIAYFEEQCVFSITIEQEDHKRDGKFSLFEMAERVYEKVISLNPTIIGIESYGYKPGYMNLDLGELVGILLYLLRDSDIRIIFISPLSVKKITTGNGKAKKTLVKKCVKNMFSITGESSHEYDAIAIAHVTKLYEEKKLDSEVSQYLYRKEIRLSYSKVEKSLT